MKTQVDSTNELATLVKMAHESPRPAILNRIARIAKKSGVSRERMAMLCRNAVESEWRPSGRRECSYDYSTPRIPCALARL